MQVATDVRAHRRCCSQSAKARLVVISDQQRGVFVELADQLEQQLAARLAERQIAEFVDDDFHFDVGIVRHAGLGSIRGVILGREKGSHLDAI